MADVLLTFDAETLAQARKLAPGWDLGALETEWRAFVLSCGVEPEDLEAPEADFLTFCLEWHKRGGPPDEAA